MYQHFDDPTLSLIDVTKTHVPLKLDGFDLGYVGGRMYFESKARAPPYQELSEAALSGAASFPASNGSESMLRGGHRLS